MDEKEIIKRKKEYDIASILDSPEIYSEEELREFFSLPENRADYRLYRLARMAENRERVASPDAERAWNSFKREVGSPSVSPVRTSSRGHVWSALMGAAAVLAGLILYYYVSQQPVIEKPAFIAMEYDAKPQLVVLQGDGEELEAFTQKDSISFYPATSLSSAVKTVTPSVKEAKAKMRTLSTPRGVDFKITLPDGTDVWLNAESSLQFPTAFTNETRKVILNGEAYFKVAHNKDCPFIVETEKMKIRVLGTEFNFRNYMSEKPQVSLIDGSISILNTSASEENIILKPGQGACVEEDGRIRVLQHVDTYGVTQWVSGYFYFRNRSLIEILQELGRWYNVGVVFENPDCINDKMHFSALRSANIEEAISNLNHLQKVKITFENNKIMVQ